ncbi:UDP-glycosyltransferase 71A15 [Vitis vinifera]|uniref:UDP-glycosyltransferase 71A15 n=1 Tax=Vitis vinifera TaxID=29760 RepID=A0A438G6Z7_VITVI|nr:UDP-glycosyltransferase 71A15 [Vitis vinifera]
MHSIHEGEKPREVQSFVNSVPAGVFPSMVLDKESGRTDVFLYHVRRFIQVKGIVVNTFMELESRAVNSFCSVAVPPVYPVGPILSAQFGEALVFALGVKESFGLDQTLYFSAVEKDRTPHQKGAYASGIPLGKFTL